MVTRPPVVPRRDGPVPRGAAPGRVLPACAGTPHGAVLALQRTAGNAAVAARVAVQRAARRPGEKWDYGPVGARKSVTVDAMTYIN